MQHAVSKEALRVYQAARIHSTSLANDLKPYAALAHMSPLQLPVGFAFEVKNRTHYKPMVYSCMVKNGLPWDLKHRKTCDTFLSASKQFSFCQLVDHLSN